MSSFIQVVISQNELQLLDRVEKWITLRKYYMSQLSEDIFVFHVDLVFVELFHFTHETLFGTPCQQEAASHVMMIVFSEFQGQGVSRLKNRINCPGNVGFS